MVDSRSALTVLIPTRNRPELCGALTLFLRKNGLNSAIILADSSDREQSEKNRQSCSRDDVEYRHYSLDVSFYEKLIDSLERVQSPFVVMFPDDDILLPHALEQCLAFLQEHDDHAVAWGYVLDYAVHANQFDIFRVRWSTPSIDEPSPFERIYHLVRRYQPFFWAVFRTEALIRSMVQARDARRVVFQELTMTLTAALQGKIARLPVVFSLRGTEPSSYDRAKVEPLFAFLDNAESFFRDYFHYRERLAAFARQHLGATAEDQLHDCSIAQFLDLVHGIGLVREIDPGPLNYIAQKALGAKHRPIPLAQAWAGWQEPSAKDAVHGSSVAGRRYIWRESVLAAEPRDENRISANEIAVVEKQVERYVL
jgi:glycosyltransferase domain-containing protein